MPRGGKFPINIADFQNVGVAPASAGKLQLNGSVLSYFNRLGFLDGGSNLLQLAKSADVASTITIPATTDTLVNLTSSQALSNKTLTAPIVSGQIIDNTYVKHGIFRKTAMADNTATAVFRVTTTNETGNTDAGAYVVVFTLLVDTNGLAGADFTGNTFAGEYKFVRSMNNTGAGGSLSETTLTAVWTSGPVTTGGGTNLIASVTVTLVEVDEYNIDVKVTCDYDNTDANRVNALIDAKLLWSPFTTAPTMSQQ